MSYTPPAGNVAHLSFPVGGSAYAPQVGHEADLSWETGVLRAKDFNTTHFGTAIAPVRHTGWLTTQFGLAVTRFTVSGIGFSTTIFGSPRWGTVGTAAATNGTTFGTPAVTPHVEPIYSTVFGLPNSPYPQVGMPDGIHSTQFGPNQRVVTTCLVFSGPPSTVISPAYTATNQTAAAVGARTTVFGSPILRVPPDVLGNYSVHATGWLATIFGAAKAPHAQTGAAYSFSWTRLGNPTSSNAFPETRFGRPVARMTLPASALAPAADFGTPILVFRAQAIRSGGFGTPATTSGHTVAAFERRTRFGTPASFLKGHRAFGINTGRRFGQPRATNRINRTATGWAVGAFGAPSAFDTHHTTALLPTTTFGVGMIKRIPEC